MRRLGCGIAAVLTLLIAAGPARGASGVWERAWGKDVDSVAAGTGPEICVIAANCQSGDFASALGGEFASVPNVATDATGHVYVVDRQNNRIQKFDSNGNFLRLWGRDVVGAGPGNTGTGAEICIAGVDTCKAGTTGTLGGELNAPNGIDVDSLGNVYVAENAGRIQVFDSNGNFQRLWGKDVITGGGTGVETCTVAANCKGPAATTGLGGEMSSPTGLSIGPDDSVYITESPTPKRVQKFDANGNFIRAWGKDVIAGGGTGYEICTVAADCQNAAVSTGLGGEFHDPSRLTVDDDGNVYVGDTSNNRVQKFDSDGNFLFLWGKDVISAGPGDAGNAAEICTIAANCKAAAPTSGLAGEFTLPASVTTDASGAVYVAEFQANGNRIQKFDSTGHFERAWGQDVVASGPGNNGIGYEICVAPADTCKGSNNAGTAFGGQVNGPTGMATDAAGNLFVADQANTRVQKWAADPPPETSIATGPLDLATSTPSFAFSSGDAGSTFECSLDGGSFSPCTSPLTTTPLADGAHELRVRATDPARQVDATPASRAFNVDTTAPDTQIDSGPDAGSTIADSTPTFSFSSSDPGAAFECRVDAGAFAPCGGAEASHTTFALADGQHTFEVRAADQVGNADPTPAARAFEVKTPDAPSDTSSPETSITKQPKRKTSKRGARFTFASNEPGSTFECRLDRGSFIPCAASARFKVKPGKHALEVRATDLAGNVDQSPAKAKWKVRR